MKWKVVLTGVRAGADPAQIAANIAGVFKVTPQQAADLLRRNKHILKGDVDEDVAQKYKRAVEAAGATCDLEPDEMLEVELPTPDPAAFFAHPVATLKEEWKKSWIVKIGGTFVGLSFVLASISMVFILFIKSKPVSITEQPPQAVLASNDLAGARILYKYWQNQNKRDAGIYEDTLIGGGLLYKCRIIGKYPAHFGYLEIKTQIAQGVVMRSAKPFTVFVGGVDYGERTRLLTEDIESGGAQTIDWFRTQGCAIPPDVVEEAQRLQLPVPTNPASSGAGGSFLVDPAQPAAPAGSENQANTTAKGSQLAANVEQCVSAKVAAFRKEVGQEPMIKADVLSEWEEVCKATSTSSAPRRASR